MMRMYFVLLVAVAWICGEVASAYFKEEGEAQESPSRYEQAMLQRLQTFLDRADKPAPPKRQMRYNQCYFNPISCFKRRK